MDELIKAILNRIRDELDRYYWNKNQKQMNSPFSNTGEIYSNNFFTVRAYNWDDESDDPKPNFESELLTCWWYKHSNRGLEYRIDFDGRKDDLEQLASFLDKCLESIRIDFGEK